MKSVKLLQGSGTDLPQLSSVRGPSQQQSQMGPTTTGFITGAF